MGLVQIDRNLIEAACTCANPIRTLFEVVPLAMKSS